MSYILQPYDDALREILEDGVRTKNRTGVDTLTIIGMQKKYDISQHFPVLTKRKIWPKSIFAELLWMLSGSTNVKDLQAMGSNIWTSWQEPEFENKHGYVEGSLGGLYGFQMRYFNGYYGNGDQNQENYGNGGFDQVSYMIKELKENPTSRRIMWSLWNPLQLDSMRLPPCHVVFKLAVIEDKLIGHLFQRSADFGCGIPSNAQFYSALIYMFAQQAGLKPHQLIHTTDNSHLYLNQLEAVEEYLSRTPPDSPKLKLNKAKDMFSYKVEDFELVDYNPLPPIKMPVEV